MFYLFVAILIESHYSISEDSNKNAYLFAGYSLPQIMRIGLGKDYPLQLINTHHFALGGAYQNTEGLGAEGVFWLEKTPHIPLIASIMGKLIYSVNKDVQLTIGAGYSSQPQLQTELSVLYIIGSTNKKIIQFAISSSHAIGMYRPFLTNPWAVKVAYSFE